MNPLKLIFSFVAPQGISAAEVLEDDAHCLHCKDFHCQQAAANMRLKLEPSYIALCERFHCAPPVVRFRALMEDMTLAQIKAELDKTVAEVKE